MKQKNLEEITDDFTNKYLGGKIGIIEGTGKIAILTSITNSNTCPDYISNEYALEHPSLVVEYIRMTLLNGRAYKKPLRKFPKNYEGIKVNYFQTGAQG